MKAITLAAVLAENWQVGGERECRSGGGSGHSSGEGSGFCSGSKC